MYTERSGCGENTRFNRCLNITIVGETARRFHHGRANGPADILNSTPTQPGHPGNKKNYLSQSCKARKAPGYRLEVCWKFGQRPRRMQQSYWWMKFNLPQTFHPRGTGEKAASASGACISLLSNMGNSCDDVYNDFISERFISFRLNMQMSLGDLLSNA